MAVPTFSLNARVIAYRGSAPPDSQPFTFWITGAFADESSGPVSAKIPVTGSTPTGPIVMGTAQLEQGQTPPGLRDVAPNFVGGQRSNHCLNDPSFVCWTLVVAGWADPTVVGVTIRVDETGRETTSTEEIFGPSLGFVAYRDGSGPHVVPMADYNQRYYDVIDARSANGSRPLRFPVVAGLDIGDHSTRNWQTNAKAMVRMGINTASHKADRVTASKRARWAREGISRLATGVYSPPGGYFDWYGPNPGDSGEVPNPAGLASWASRLAGYVTAAGFAPTDVVDFVLADEPGYTFPSYLILANNGNNLRTYPSGAMARQELAAFLVSKGITPRDVGLPDFGTVGPVGPSLQAATRVTDRRLFYWSMRWFAESTAAHFARCTRALETAFFAGMPIGANWSNLSARFFSSGAGDAKTVIAAASDGQVVGSTPSDVHIEDASRFPAAGSVDVVGRDGRAQRVAYTGGGGSGTVLTGCTGASATLHTGDTVVSADNGAWGHDWFEYATQRGGTQLSAENWAPNNASPQVSDIASRLRSAARAPGLGIGGYVVAIACGGAPGGGGEATAGLVKKAMALVSHGAKSAYFYGAAQPEYLKPNEGAFETMQAYPSIAAGIAEVADTLAKAEDLLWPGAAPPNPVAILHPRSSMAWDTGPVVDGTNNYVSSNTVDYLGEVHGIYLALQHANYQVDWIDEDELSAEGLRRFKVLYCTAPNLPSAGHDALRAWVEGGGTLVTVAGTGLFDRYNSRLSTVGDMAGRPGDHLRTYYGDPLGLPPADTVTSPDDSRTRPHHAVPATTTIVPAGDATVQATFDSIAVRTPAIVDRPLGANGGRVRHFAFFPGISYTASGSFSETYLPTGFDETLRRWIVAPVELAGVANRTVVDTPLVEAPVLASPGGWAVTYLNWTDAPFAAVGCRVRSPFTPTRVTSVKHGDIAFTRTQDGVTFAMPLGATDVVRLYAPPSTGTPSEGWGMIPI